MPSITGLRAGPLLAGEETTICSFAAAAPTVCILIFWPLVLAVHAKAAVCVRLPQAMRRSDSFDSVKSAQSFISANSAERDGSGAGQVPPYAGGSGGRCASSNF